MFDNVGRTLDAGAGRRRAASLLFVGTGLSGSIVFALVWGAMTVIEPSRPAPTPPPEPIRIVELAEKDFRPEAPAAPRAAPPPPLAGVAGAPEPTDEPDEAVDDPTPLTEIQKEPIANQQQTAGSAQGDPDGSLEGEPGGLRSGQPGGSGDGLGGGAPRYVSAGALEVRRRVMPSYPAAAETMGLGEQVCAVSMEIDDKGRPRAIEISGCPDVFHAEAREAMSRWRWYPPRVDRQRGVVRTRIAVRFVSR